MKNVPENELFSAYLDGELTADQQADVERLLASSPAARQLMDELRALSSTLQSMPVRKLPEDLTDQVLRMAERRMLQGEPEPSPLAAAPREDSDIAPPASPWKGIGRRLLTPRNLLWPGMAVAVAWMIMLLGDADNQRPAADRREVAMAPEAAMDNNGPEETEDAAAVPTVRARDAKRKNVESEETPLMVAKDAVDKETAAKKRVESKTYMKRAERFAVTGSRAAGDPESEMGIAPQTAPMDKAAVAPQGNAVVAKPGVPPAPGAKSDDGAAPARAFASKMAAGGAGRGGMLNRQPGSFDVAGQQPAKPRAGRGKGAGGGSASAGPPAKLQTPRSSANMAAADTPAATQLPDQSQLVEGTTVVFCDVTAEAVRSRAFDRLLSRQQIVWEESAPAAGGLVQRRAQAEGEGAQLGAAAQVANGSREKELDVVLVEAAPAQIEATLAAMNAQPQAFVTVCVAPAPSLPKQQDWARFDRRASGRQGQKQFGAAMQPGKVAAGHDGGLAAGQEQTQRPLPASAAPQKSLGRARRVAIPVDEAQRRLASQADQPLAAESFSQGGRPPAAAMADSVRPPAAAEPLPQPKAAPAAKHPRPSAVVQAAPEQRGIDMKPSPQPEEAAPSDADHAAAEPTAAESQATDSPTSKPAEPTERKVADANPNGPAEKAEEKANEVRQEMAKGLRTEAATCRVLFVLRAVNSVDASAKAAVSAVRVNEDGTASLKQAAPPPAAEIDAAQTAPAAEPAPAAKD